MKPGWEVKPLGEVCEIRGGGTPSKQKKEFWGGDVPWVSPKDMKFPTIVDSIDKTTDEAVANSAAKHIPKGAILIVVRSGILSRTIPVAIAGRDLTVNQDLKALLPSRQMEAQFLTYFLEAHEKLLLDKVTRGATVHKIDTPVIKGLEVPIPPLEEQKRIVAVLDAAFEGLTRAKENAEANLQNARELFESFANTVVQNSLRDYQIVNLPEVSENLDRQRVPITKSDRTAGEIPYYGASGVVDHVSDHLFDEDLLLVSEDGANLLARTYPIAFSVSGKIWVNNHAHVLRFKERSQQEFVSL